MQISGHKTRAIFDRYQIVSDGDLREAAARMEAATKRESNRVTTTTSTTGGSEETEATPLTH